MWVVKKEVPWTLPWSLVDSFRYSSPQCKGCCMDRQRCLWTLGQRRSGDQCGGSPETKRSRSGIPTRFWTSKLLNENPAKRRGFLLNRFFYDYCSVYSLLRNIECSARTVRYFISYTSSGVTVKPRRW